MTAAVALSPERRARIRALHRLRPWRNLRIVEFLAIWAIAGWTAVHVPILAVRLVCWFVIGATIQGLVILMHEGVHRILFRQRFWNRWIAFCCGLPAGLSVTGYRVGHLPHHRYERGARDPDELENFARGPRSLAVLIGLTLLGGELFGFTRVGPAAAWRCRGRERRDVLIEYALIVALYVLLFRTAPFATVLQVWLIPALFARQLTNVRTVAEHVLTGHGGRLTVTRTVTSTRFVSFFMCNLNYHLAHHLYPAVPWYHLPALHAELAGDFRRAGAQVYPSYTAFLRDLGAFMWRAWRPGGGPVALTLPVRRAA